MRRLSQIGAGTTGWRSDLETHGSKQSIGTFVIGAILALVMFAGIILLLWALA